MKRIVAFIITVSALAVFFSNCGIEQQDLKTGKYSIAFYNVENLFDTINDPNIDDEEFLPDSKIFWNSDRYHKKLLGVARVLSSIDTLQMPLLIGLCEIENKGVVEDLLHLESMKAGAYHILHQNSPDNRGIDVALLYRNNYFKPLTVNFLPVHFPFDKDNKTRDILYAKGLMNNDTLHVFVNHWTSRWGGRWKTEKHRNYIAGYVHDIVDSIQNVVPKANILIMGDMNDNPNDKSLKTYLNAHKTRKNIKASELYNLSWRKFLKGEGSLYWKAWDMFDQVIVSGTLLNQKGKISITPYEQFVFKPDWLLFETENGEARPNRTKGRNYYGGFSDHLPVYVKINLGN